MEISVIMAVFDGEESVSDSIESILNQTFQDFEFIIVDDGSTDKTFEIIESYMQKDKRIKLIRNLENIGLTKSLNKAIKKSKGKFIARQDADDISLPERLEKEIKFLNKNPDYDFCGSDEISKQGKINITKYFEFSEIKRHLIEVNCFFHSSILIRKKVFYKFGFYRENRKYGQDYELWCRLVYKYRLKAKNLRDKLIIFNWPSVHKMQKKKKFIQNKNHIKTQLLYLRYYENKIYGIKSIIKFLCNFFCEFLFNINSRA